MMGGSKLHVFNGSTRSSTGPVSFLVDTGADRIFVNRDRARQLGNLFKGPDVEVEYGNGTTGLTNDWCWLHCDINGFKFSCKAVATDIAGYDIVLGLSWLEKYNPEVDFTRSIYKIRHKKGFYRLITERRDHELVNLAKAYSIITASQVRAMSKSSTCTSLLYVVRELDDAKNNSMIPNAPKRYEEVLKKYQHLFRSELPDKPPPDDLPKHSIDILPDASPINTAAYGLTFEKQVEQKKQIKDLLDKGLIRPSSSPWGSPVLFVGKPDGSWRMCIDYRGLNDRTAKNTYPLPKIQECVDRVGQARIISKIDLTSGFWQIGMEKDSIPRTAFNTRMGKFEFLVMPFGLTNAPATFQTIMNNALREYLDDFVLVYLDDILIFSNTEEDHERHLSLVLDTLERHHLYAKPSKCIIGVPEVEFCGFVVGNGVVRTQRSKTDLIKDWPVPSTIHDVRAFLGLASYYRRFVRGFADISAPLSDLLKEDDAELRTKKYRPTAWNPMAQIAFDRLKQCLTSEPVLAQPNPLKPYRIETDASAYAIGYVLLQTDDDGAFHPIAFDGRKLQGAELNYSVQEKELLAIKSALRTWDHYVRNNQLISIFTDHKSLSFLCTSKHQSARLERWIDEFGGYNLEINYRPGTESLLPDTISRKEDFEDRSELKTLISSYSNIHSFDEDLWHDCLIQYITKRQEPPNESMLRSFQSDRYHPASSFDVVDGILYKKHSETERAPFLERGHRAAYLNQIHRDYGHLGWPGLASIVRTRAWFPSIEQSIKRLISNCPNCLASKGSASDQHRGAATRTLEKKDIGLFDQWSLDLIGPLPWSFNGNRWLITAIERSTGWPEAAAYVDATTETVVEFIHNRVFSQYGIPSEILTDNGLNLVSFAMENYLSHTGTKHRRTTPYHPQTNGKIERFNGTMGKMLTRYLYGRSVRLWDEYVTQALFAVRIHTHATSGYSPFYLMYGCHPRLPGDPAADLSNDVAQAELLAKVGRANDARKAANAALVEKAAQAGLLEDDKGRLPTLRVGDFVLVRNESALKLQPKWFGPYKIIMSSPFDTYAIQDCHTRVVRDLINGNRLRLIDKGVVTIDGKWKDGSETKLALLGKIRPPTKEEIELERHEFPAFTYKELATITKREWTNLLAKGLANSDLGGGRIDGASIEGHIHQKLLDRLERMKKSTIATQNKDLAVETSTDTIPKIPSSNDTPINENSTQKTPSTDDVAITTTSEPGNIESPARKAEVLLRRPTITPPPIDIVPVEEPESDAQVRLDVAGNNPFEIAKEKPTIETYVEPAIETTTELTAPIPQVVASNETLRNPVHQTETKERSHPNYSLRQRPKKSAKSKE